MRPTTALKLLTFLAPLGLPLAAHAEIQPQSGLWSGTARFTGQSGCPPQVTASMQANAGSYAGRQIDFAAPFNPVALQGAQENFQWTKLAADRWQGVFAQSQATQMGDLVATTQTVITVLSPSQISQESVVIVDMPAALAQLTGMTGTRCQVNSVTDHRKQ